MRLSLITSLSLLLGAEALAISPETTDAREIMAAVENRDIGDRATSRLSITITDKAGRERTRGVQSRSMEFEAGRKQLMLFESPADVRNAGLFSVDYDDGAKADDQWLYLPSLGKTTRISSADKSGSFMGTDLTYSDMTKRDPDVYDYTLVEASTQVGGEDCWLIESRPKTDKEKSETGYLKTHVWISKAKLIPIQVKAWVAEGKRLKYTQFKDVREVDGIWVAQQILVRTVRNGEPESSSALVFTEMKFNDESVVVDDFSERRLEQGL